MMAGWTLLLVLIVLGAWALLARGGRSRGGSGGPQSDDGAEGTLRERYARGEIDEETYRRKLEELRRS